MKQSLSLILFIFISSISFSQNFIKGSVTDSTKAPMPFCPMVLLNAKDSSLVKGNISDSAGVFVFEKIKAGTYFIKFNAVGYKALNTAAFSIDSLSQTILEPQILKAEGVNLKEVSIAVFKPIIEFKKGMIIMNVENNIMAGGNTVFELLKRIPGVSIDAQNNILVNGKGGVRFLMDGRLQQIPMAQMINLLMGMPADAVSVLELITNPPAKYDAAGTGGLINIVLKKAKVKGFSGSLAQSVSRGDNWRGGTFAGFNYKANKLTVFTNLNLSYLQFETYNHFERRITDSTGTFEIISEGNQRPMRNIFFGNAGLEYELSKKTILGFNVNGNVATIDNVEKAQVNVISEGYVNYNTVKFRNDSKAEVANPTYNANITHKFDSVTNLSFSADYTNYVEKASRFNTSHYYDNANVEVVPVNRFGSTMNSNFNIYTQKLDFDKAFKKSWSIETGAKSSFVNNDVNSVVQLTDPATQTLYVDSNYSNNYNYKERILAGYFTLGKEFKKVDIRLGIRAEHTMLDGNNDPKPFTLHRDYLNFFPSGSVDIKLNPKNTIQTSYSYRISRPSYDQLNPTRTFNDPFSNGAGNPFLNPAYSHNMTLSYNYNNFITVNLDHVEYKDNMYFYAYGDPTTKITIDSVFNYKHQAYTNLNVFVQKQIKWLNFSAFASVFLRNNNTIIQGNAVTNKSYVYTYNVNFEFILPKDWKIQARGYFNSGGYDGIQTYNPSGDVALTVFRSFFKKKLDISLSLFDALYTNIEPNSNQVGGLYSYYTERNDTRRIRLWIMWRFGKMRLNQNVKRSNDEEKGRLKSVN